MTKKMGVEILIDLEKFVDIIQDRMAQRVAVAIRIEAKKKVRKDTWHLHNMITTDRIAPGHYETSVISVYAPAQEWGRPDIPNYGYTPYMRPAAQISIEEKNLKSFLKEAEEAALLGAKIK